MVNYPMPTKQHSATAVAHPNIAFIKYWGIKDPALTIPDNSSLSMNLAGLESRTTVTFSDGFKTDTLSLNGEDIEGGGLKRAIKILDQVRQTANLEVYAQIISENNFPTGSGIASSASGFAALALAASSAAGLTHDQAELSRLARISSGSASRSIPGGFVEWQAGFNHHSSYAFSIAPPEHWQLADCVAIVSQEHKKTHSLGGHALAHTSPLQQTRVSGTESRLKICRQAILDKDFNALADVTELDSTMMHAVMMTSSPNLFYWQPTTLEIMKAVQQWRAQGLAVCFTIDAGPNVHVICPQEIKEEVSAKLLDMPGVQKVLTAMPGGPAHLVE